jgi:hypothetical protein
MFGGDYCRWFEHSARIAYGKQGGKFLFAESF